MSNYFVEEIKLLDCQKLCGKAWIAYLGIVQEYDVRAKQIINRYEYNI